MSTKPLILFDPFPRNEEMVFTEDVKSELNKISRLVYHFGSRAPEELIEKNLEDIEILVGQTAMPKERLDKSKKIKAIINVKANWEPNIDYHEAHKRGIYVLSAAPAMAPAVAEACLGYAISLSRDVLGVYKKFLKSEEQYGIKQNKYAYTLFNSKVGFIGFGNLAKSLLTLLEPFHCNVSVYDPWLSEDYLLKQNVQPTSLESVLSNNEFIFILAGVTTENEGFINRDKLNLIKKNSSVILVSRAEVVDFDAFIELAENEHFRAAIDVFPVEPVPKNSNFRKKSKILFTSHVAGALHYSYKNIREMMMSDIKNILKGMPPLNLQRADPDKAIMRRDR